MSKKCTMLGALLEVEMSKKCEAHFDVKIVKKMTGSDHFCVQMSFRVAGARVF